MEKLSMMHPIVLYYGVCTRYVIAHRVREHATQEVSVLYTSTEMLKTRIHTTWGT